jgi:iron complex outermembrane receptor protein
VTSASRQAESIGQAASAIQVISQEDIRRSGATSIPEALRLASNLQVAQVNASQWAISARGFNNVLANKLLVMIDGRTVYTPLYAGVFWDAQDYLLEDIDRIEVISGPGGTLWGANAVNGVINIITKSAADTQGLFLEAGTGQELREFAGLRYGGESAAGLHYRVYAKAFDRDATRLVNGADANDEWDMTQAGFRLDRETGNGNQLTLQADYYDGKPNPDGVETPVTASGGNLLGQWTREASNDGEARLQWYYDRTSREYGNGLEEDLDTVDVDWQHRLAGGSRQQIIWGFGIRSMDHEMINLPLFGFLPADRTLRIYSTFIQDEISVIDGRLSLTLGTKLSNNSYTGLEAQPSVRATWTLSEGQTLWAGVSRAVRTPARIDRDFSLRLAPDFPILQSDPNFDSEDVLAYELGWRARARERVSLAIAAFFNEYDNLRSAEAGPPPFGFPITIQNGVRGDTQGIELYAIYEATERWRLRGGYTYLNKDLEVKPGHTDLNEATSESNDPEHQLVLQSIVDLPGNLQLDAVLRHVGELPDPEVPSYSELDLRIAWTPNARLELAIVGKNLLHDRHAEFIPDAPSPREIERSILGTIAWRH